MSAIAGIVSLNGAPLPASRLDRIARAVSFLQTDRVGAWSSDHVGLLHFALATTPQSLDEVQPALDPAAGTAIVFDGRLDNRDDLLRGLRARELSSESPDSQIVQALFARDGVQCPRHMVGDYAFAIWQQRERRLFCARSPVGWRPLVWCRSAGVFAFATEIKALIDGLPVARRPNEGALAEFLSARFVTPTETLWRDVYRLAPGAALEVQAGAATVRCRQWHDGPFPEIDGSQNELAERFLELFDAAVCACTRSCTPVAAHLSGGLDSSSVVCRATQLHRSGRIDRQVAPVSVRFPGEQHDESGFSRAVCDFTGLEAMVPESGPFSWERSRRWCEDTLHLPLRPNVVAVILPTLELARAHGMRVVLTGEGGDDWLAGSWSHWPDLLLRGRLLALGREAVAAPGSGRARLRYVAGSLLPLVSSARRAQLEHPSFPFSLRTPPWIGPEWGAAVGLTDRWRNDVAPVKLDSFAQRARFARYGVARFHVNLDNLLALSGRLGIELRHPLHDLRLTHFLMGVPGDALRRGDQTKFLLREAMRGSLPEKIRARAGKTTFGLPMLRALDALLTTVKVADLHPVRLGWVDGDRLGEAVTAWRSWYGSGRTVHADPLVSVWSTVAVHLWLEHAAQI